MIVPPTEKVRVVLICTSGASQELASLGEPCQQACVADRRGRGQELLTSSL
jgi:hypothetical protein